MHEQNLLQHQCEVFFMNPLEEELLMIANVAMPEEVQHQLELLNPQVGNPPSPINFLDEEIPCDQLLGSDNEGSPVHSEENAEQGQLQQEVEQMLPLENAEQGHLQLEVEQMVPDLQEQMLPAYHHDQMSLADP